MDYREMTVDQLKAERAKIEAEIKSRLYLAGLEVIIDPSIPPNAFDVVQGPHRVRVTVHESSSEPQHGEGTNG